MKRLVLVVLLVSLLLLGASSFIGYERIEPDGRTFIQKGFPMTYISTYVDMGGVSPALCQGGVIDGPEGTVIGDCTITGEFYKPVVFLYNSVFWFAISSTIGVLFYLVTKKRKI